MDVHVGPFILTKQPHIKRIQRGGKTVLSRCHINTVFFLGKLMRFLALPMKLRLSCQRVSTIIVHKFGHYPFMEFNLHKTLIPFVSKP